MILVRRRMILVLAALALQACAAPDKVLSGPSAPAIPTRESGYKLVKNWDFVKHIRTQVDLRAEFHTRYIYDKGRLDHLNDEWQRYRDNDNHVFTPRGLSLVARAPHKLAAGHIESGMLRSRWSGRYGVYEIRMKVPSALGTWPAFWLNPQDGTWPPEIDVVEVVNNGRDDSQRSFHFLHGKGGKGGERRTFKLNRHEAYRPGFDYADGFHNFAVEWTPDAVRHYVDGVLITDRDFKWVHDDGRDAGDAHVLVNLAVGGKWPGEPAANSLPASLDIEYIRVWQR